jgi:hypothetical protein
MDIVDGHLVPPRIADGAEDLVGTHEGSVWVEAGGSLEVLGVLQGTLHFEAGSQGVIIGGVQGSLTVAPDAALAVKAEEPDRTAA